MKSKLFSVFLIGILFFLPCKTSFSQTENNYKNNFIDLLKSENNHKYNKSNYKGLIGFYKKFISSQDAGSCPYSPSCSLYAYKSVKKHGIFFGLIKAFDRLSRCNRSQEEYYEHTKDNKLIDYP
ncbi:MAG: membrane protein insertion efficiency factor YidD [Bacteroidales bacterium]|nr:membrane protein insertion efficiency factor YidD [Bacteroidales bacterium]